MTIVKFQEVSIKGRKRIKVDGKWKYRQKTFSQTINPWNKNKNGEVKTREEIIKELNTELTNWTNKDEDD